MYNETIDCSGSSITDASEAAILCDSITISSITTYTTTITNSFIDEVIFTDGSTLAFNIALDVSTTIDKNKFINQTKTYIDNIGFYPTTVTVTGSYIITIVSTVPITSLKASTDTVLTGQTTYNFIKDISL